MYVIILKVKLALSLGQPTDAIFKFAQTLTKTKLASSYVTINWISRKMYALLTPTKPTELSFTEIVEIMGRHSTPKPIVIAERYKFHRCNQVEGQSIREFLARLQKLAETCEWILR